MRISSRRRARRWAGVFIVLMAAWGTGYPRIVSPVRTEPSKGRMDLPNWAHLGLFEERIFRTAEPGSAHGDRCGSLHLHARLVSGESVDDKTPWAPGDIVSGDDLARAISSSRGVKPVVLQVGIEALYKDAHIPDAIFAGPAAEPEGMAALKAKAKTIARNKEVVIYCGCCPWRDCPNIRPAFIALQQMGFRKVKLLNIPTDFQQDWVNKGFPTVRS